MATRVSTGEMLWNAVLASGYLESDPLARETAMLGRLLPKIRRHLVGETHRPADRPNALGTLALLGLIIPEVEQLLHEGHFVFSPEVRANAGPYSSIYSCLLALLVDDVAIDNFLSALHVALPLPSVVSRLGYSVLLPGPLQRAAYFRGQVHDWPPLPKSLRNGASQGWGQRLKTWAADLLASAKFAGALGGSGIAINPAELEAIRQHYGFATTFLDLSSSIEVAAYFATDGATPGDTGVIYRVHQAHPYALHLIGSCCAKVGGVSSEIRERLATVVNQGLGALEFVSPQGILRIERQSAVFARGGVSAFHNFLQPVYFRQHAGIRYERPSRGITQSALSPSDDPIARLVEQKRP